jgi:two-component system, cell cycle sensor histidine kinase and response regulator CckA
MTMEENASAEEGIPVRLLIVEDDQTQRLKLTAILESQGYDVAVAADGVDGLEKVKSLHPDLVLSDIIMPRMDGYELCRAIRNDPALIATRVVLLTAQGEMADVIKGLEAGADNYVTKPYDTKRLLGTCEAILADVSSEGEIECPCHAFPPLAVDEAHVAIRSSRKQILNFFVSMYRDAQTRHTELQAAHKKLRYYSEHLSQLVEERTAEALDAHTRQRKAEEESQSRAKLLDKAHDAIIVTDYDSQIKYWNEGAERLYGWTSAEVVGRTIGSILHDVRHPASTEALRSVVEWGKWEGELFQIAKDGGERTVQSSWTLLTDDEDNSDGILSINVDITEKKTLEAKFLRTQRLESIGMLAGGIAHDLNNLVGPILMGAELLKRKIQDEDVRRTLGVIESGARRAVDVVQQVLTFARGTTGERVRIQVKHLLKEMQQIIRGSFPPSITLGLDFTKDLPLVLGDTTQIHQVLMNLCVNARDAMPDGGMLSLGAKHVTIDEAYVTMDPDSKPGEYVEITVKDSGTGMPPHVKERIFEPFFTTKEAGKGTGLGLPTVLSIVRGHGGFMHVESEQGRGTSFHIFIPVAPRGGEDVMHTHDKAAPAGNGELILFVDDEQILREVVGTTLERSGYRVVTASDGIEALARFAEQGKEIGVTVIDLLMPNLDGPVTIKTMRKLNPDARVVAISGHEEAMRQAGATLTPPVTMLSKPFTSEELLMTIHEQLHREQ